MPLTYEISGDFLRYTVNGDVEYEAGLAVLVAGLSEVQETRVGIPTPVIFDIRDSAESRGAEELRGIAAVVGQYSDAVGRKCAVIAASGLYYGVSRMFAAFVEEHGIEMQIFDSIPKAEAWLAVGGE